MASERALAAGTTLAGVFDAVKRIRERSDVPILFFTYMGPVLAYGVERFAADAVAAGVDGLLPLDLPPEEDPGILASLREAGLANVCLAAPNSSPERRRELAAASRGFLYYVCRLGVTDERSSLPEDLGEQLELLKASSDAPVCIGLGFRRPNRRPKRPVLAMV